MRSLGLKVDDGLALSHPAAEWTGQVSHSDPLASQALAATQHPPGPLGVISLQSFSVFYLYITTKISTL